MIKKLSKEEAIQSFRDLTREQRIRLMLLELFGFRCRHCGNTDYRVLQLDHVNNDAPGDRKKYGLSKRKIYLKLINGTLDKSRYQLLCANCNQIKKFS